jgi:glycosyl transferase family 25
MQKQLDCYVINLASDTVRKERMQQRLSRQGITAHFFPATDGRIMDDAELERHVNRSTAAKEYGTLSKAEIGTALSHIRIYRHMVENNIPFAVILEDDVCLAENFSELIATASENGMARLFSPNHAVMLQLTHIRRGYRTKAKPLGNTGYEALKAYSSVWLASGYMISLAGAKALSQALYPVWTVADHWDRFRDKGLVELWALSPNAVWEAEEAQQSNLTPTRKPRTKPKKTLAHRLASLWRNLFVKPFFVKKVLRKPERVD